MERTAESIIEENDKNDKSCRRECSRSHRESEIPAKFHIRERASVDGIR